jgi:hypothetical protein
MKLYYITGTNLEDQPFTNYFSSKVEAKKALKLAFKKIEEDQEFDKSERDNVLNGDQAERDWIGIEQIDDEVYEVNFTTTKQGILTLLNAL